MVTIGMNYKILPGKEGVFENAFARVLQLMETMDGHTQSALYKDVHDAQQYLIVSEWGSEDAYNAFIQSGQFAGVVDWGKEHILAGRPSHTLYRH